LRQALAGHEELTRKLDAFESRYDRQFGAVFEALRQLMAPPASARRSRGLNPESDSRWASVTRRLAPMR
jgi:hypothetical protein